MLKAPCTDKVVLHLHLCLCHMRCSICRCCRCCCSGETTIAAMVLMVLLIQVLSFVATAIPGRELASRLVLKMSAASWHLLQNSIGLHLTSRAFARSATPSM